MSASMLVQPLPWVLIAANPKSGAGSSRERVLALRDEVAGAGFHVELCESLEQVAKRSRELHESGSLRAIVSAGGDGTAAAIVNLVPPDVPLALFPLGTENLLAKHLGLTADAELVLACLRDGQIYRLDVGRANGKIFLVMLGCGFDAEVVRRMHSIRRGHIRRWSYAKPIWDAVRTYGYPEIEIEFGGQEALEPTKPEAGLSQELQATNRSVKLSTAWMFAFNLPRYAANLQFCPQAIDNDGLLDICTFHRGGFWRSIWYLSKLWRGKHQSLSDFAWLRARKITLRAAVEIPYQLDGDPGGVLPVEIDIVPSRLSVLVPRK